MESQEHRSLSGLALLVIAVASGCLTWLCVRWFGAQAPLTAAIAIILVELFIASFAMIAVLLVERLSASYLHYEETYLERPAAPRRMWLWRPLWQPQMRSETQIRSSVSFRPPVSIDGWLQDVHSEMTPLDADSPAQQPVSTVTFPGRSTERPTDSTSAPPRRRAA